MSGRSAIVRKEKTKTKVKEVLLHSKQDTEQHLHYGEPASVQQPKLTTSRSNSSYSTDDPALARAKKPQVPDLDVSGIEKSEFRTNMDKKTTQVRKTLGGVFSGKKKKNEKIEAAQRSESAQTFRSESHNYARADSFSTNSLAIRTQQSQIFSGQDYARDPASPKLSDFHQSSLKRWLGNGRAQEPWDKLQKDPELWNHGADTEVFFCRPNDNKPPSFIIHSQTIEASKSVSLINMLQQGWVDDHNFNGMPPPPTNLQHVRPGFSSSAGRSQYSSPPTSNRNFPVDSSINYRLYFPAPPDLNAYDALRHQTTTRNFFALLCGASIVGFNLFQALNDLRERAEIWLPEANHEAQGPIGKLLCYIEERELDDVRGKPFAAAALLALYEHPSVRYAAGWRETFIHACGMYNEVAAARVEYEGTCAITKAMVEEAGGEMEMKANRCASALRDFDFEEVWAEAGERQSTVQASVGRSAFTRLRKFLVEFYKRRYGSWPPSTRGAQSQWLGRKLARDMSEEFASLYDYFVDREIGWKCDEERFGRKWNLVRTKGEEHEITPDSEGVPFTDIITTYDNRREYPHIPHPYPLIPAKSTDSYGSVQNRSSQANPQMLETESKVAYSKASNVYKLGPEFKHTELINAFAQFEKSDQPGFYNLKEARLGRWVLIYCVLQALASISVDTPNMKRTGVNYYVNPRIGRGVPWKGHSGSFDEAHHNMSHCWKVRESWDKRHPVSMVFTDQDQLSSTEHGDGYSSWASDDGTTMRSSILTNVPLIKPGVDQASIRSRAGQYVDDLRGHRSNQHVNQYSERKIQIPMMSDSYDERLIHDPRKRYEQTISNIRGQPYHSNHHPTGQHIVRGKPFSPLTAGRGDRKVSSPIMDGNNRSLPSLHDMASSTGYAEGIAKVETWADHDRSGGSSKGDVHDASSSEVFATPMRGNSPCADRREISPEKVYISPRAWMQSEKRSLLQQVQPDGQEPKPAATFIKDFDNPDHAAWTGEEWPEQPL